MSYRRMVTVAGVSLVWFLADLATKNWALQTFEGDPRHMLGPLWFRLARNSGSAFGIGSGYGSVIGIVAFVILVVSLLLVRQFQSTWSLALSGLVIGGAAGNLGDRIFRAEDGFLSGAVVDFIDLTWWPIFNVADVGIVMGLFGIAVLVTLQQAKVHQTARAAYQAAAEAAEEAAVRAASGEAPQDPAEAAGQASPDP